ncbi:acetyl-CoA sensor PanZ family protein [Litoribacillus peritrichatus]|uniref:PanZ acetyltransferase (GNAT) domain-containing protein n=1 Tax=Litoribacillus peritrichatus TaxID=718191 RepID=A0ABP7MSC0_9GAMM
MPVILRKVTSPVDQDQIDLNKTFGELQELIINDQVVKNDNGHTEQLISQFNEPDHKWIASAFFNDRIIGAICVEEQTGQFKLSNFTVRKVTQDRGVGHRLLDLTLVEAKGKAVLLELTRDQNVLMKNWLNQYQAEFVSNTASTSLYKIVPSEHEQ